MLRRILPLFWLLMLVLFAAELPLIAETVSGITPSSVTAGSGGFVISVSGSGFSSASIVRMTGTTGVHSLQTYFVNSNLLLAGVTSIEIAQPGAQQINVVDYAAQSSSDSVTLSVLASGSSGGSGTTTPPPPTPPSSGGCYGCVTPPPSGGGSGGGTSGGSGGGSSGGSGTPVTSPSGSNMLVTVTSPTAKESVNGAITVTATATTTSKTDGGIVYWAIFDSGNLLWVDVNPDASIHVDLALSKGAHTIQVSAYDDSYTPSTATIPVTATSSGNVISWHACMYTKNGQRYQAMQIDPQETVTGTLQSQMFWNSNCNPTQWTDQLNDVGGTMTFEQGSSWLYYFIHRADIPGVSAVWTIGNQSSGCVNYNTAPACN